MNRPFYKKPRDTFNENEIIKRFCKDKLDYMEAVMGSGANFLAHGKNNPDMKFAIEIVTRTTPQFRYKTYDYSQMKYNKLIKWEPKGYNPILIVRFSDFLGCVRCPVEHTVDEGGRKDRNDPFDQEPMIQINPRRFEEII